MMKVWRVEIKNEKTEKHFVQYGTQSGTHATLPSLIVAVVEHYENITPIKDLADERGGYTIKVSLVEGNRDSTP